jgi:hypothetical protein
MPLTGEEATDPTQIFKQAGGTHGLNRSVRFSVPAEVKSDEWPTSSIADLEECRGFLAAAMTAESMQPDDSERRSAIPQ